MSEAFAVLFLLLVAVCALLAVASLLTPKAAALLRQKTKGRGFLAWLGLGVIFFVAMLICAPKDGASFKVQQQATAPAPAPKVEKPSPAPKVETPAPAKIETQKAEAPKPAPVPHYVAKVESDMPGIKLSLDCTIDAPVDKAVLEKLAHEIFAKHKGKKYERVFVMWYLPHYKHGSGAWAVSNFERGKLTELRILALQG